MHLWTENHGNGDSCLRTTLRWIPSLAHCILPLNCLVKVAEWQSGFQKQIIGTLFPHCGSTEPCFLCSWCYMFFLVKLMCQMIGKYLTDIISNWSTEWCCEGVRKTSTSADVAAPCWLYAIFVVTLHIKFAEHRCSCTGFATDVVYLLTISILLIIQHFLSAQQSASYCPNVLATSEVQYKFNICRYSIVSCNKVSVWRFGLHVCT